MKLRALILSAVVGLAVPCATVSSAAAQDWPTRTVKFLVPYGPGGGTDIVSRIIAQHMQELLGQSFVVENKPGAGSTLGADTVAKGDKDGYTVLV